MNHTLGLSSKEAKRRLSQYGYNRVLPRTEHSFLVTLLQKFLNPLTLSLIVIAVVSLLVGQKVDSLLIILMAVLSVVLSFLQEHSAALSARKLRSLVRVTVIVIRDGKKIAVPLRMLVPGDVVELSAGKMIPADGEMISAKNLRVNQSSLTGESFPVVKQVTDKTNVASAMFESLNRVFMGSDVVGGTGLMIVTATGKNTEFGKLSHAVAETRKQTSYDRGVRNYTNWLIRIIVVLIVFLFTANFWLKGEFASSLLFALAVAIGITPEMLPMIMTINLSRGARAMAKKRVIIKELASIQNFGAMDILCTDKTGTLTNNQVALIASYDCDGEESEQVFKIAYLNSYFQDGLDNVLDSAVLHHKTLDMSQYEKVDEVPYDFERRIVSVVVSDVHKTQLIAKGAPESIFALATHYLEKDKIEKMNAGKLTEFDKHFQRLSGQGFRVLAVAVRGIEKKDSYQVFDETDLVFVGFMAFLDPPKASATEAILKLQELGVKLKVLSGDSELVTEHIVKELNLPIEGILTGTEIDRIDDARLMIAVETTNIFTRLTPVQKERVVRALQKNQHIVGYLGDGINDAPALKASDVGISVNNATDIAKETAEVILLEKDLRTLANCVVEGRRTFANTTKYIKMGASSTFGNMFSMAGASLLLPFLPLLPAQILLNDFLYDLSQVALPTDNVDDDLLKTPRPWDIKFIKEFVLFLGPVSSIFDFATFWVMINVFHAPQALFQTGWFVESLITQTLVVYIIRTRKIPFLESRPSKWLILTTLLILGVGITLPFTTLGQYWGFTPLPPLFFLIIAGISVSYLLLVQLVKNMFIKKYGYE